MFSIAAINDTDTSGKWEPLAPTKEAQHHEGSMEELHKLSDAREFQETEIMKARNKLRSIRAKFAVLEGKLSLEIIEAQNVTEEEQRRINAFRGALLLLRTICIVWPNSVSEVLLAGSFDGWTSQRKMEQADSSFSLQLKLYPGRYELIHCGCVCGAPASAGRPLLRPAMMVNWRRMRLGECFSARNREAPASGRSRGGDASPRRRRAQDSLDTKIRPQVQSFAVDPEDTKSKPIVKRIYGSLVPVLDGETLSVRILVDHSIVESFAQGGRTTIMSRVYPTTAIYGKARLFLFNNATGVDVTAKSLKIWQMDSAFSDQASNQI